MRALREKLTHNYCVLIVSKDKSIKAHDVYRCFRGELKNFSKRKAILSAAALVILDLEEQQRELDALKNKIVNS